MADDRTVVESVKGAKLFSDGTILFEMVRLSHPHVFHMFKRTDPKTGKVSEAYSCAALLPKDTHEEAYKLCRKVMTKILTEKNNKQKIGSDKRFIRDGDAKDEDDAVPEEHVGMYVVSSRETKKRPQTLHRYKDPDTGGPKRLVPDVKADEDVIYGGCWGNLLVRPWWQDNEYGKRINASTVAVQFRKDDTPFGQGRISDKDIDSTFTAEDEEDSVDGADDGDI